MASLEGDGSSRVFTLVRGGRVVRRAFHVPQSFYARNSCSPHGQLEGLERSVKLLGTRCGRLV